MRIGSLLLPIQIINKPGHGTALQIDTSSEFPIHALPAAEGEGCEHVLCLLLSPTLQDFVHELQDDHDDQAPFTEIFETYIKLHGVSRESDLRSVPYNRHVCGKIVRENVKINIALESYKITR